MWLWSMVLGVTGWSTAVIPGAIAPIPVAAPTPIAPIRPVITCPTTLDDLQPLLLRDIPSYTNRVLARARSEQLPSLPPSYILLAGHPEQAPLTLGPGVYAPTTADPTAQQLFFTTLERQYGLQQVTTLESYHWVFLTRTQRGWRLVFMFSRTGSATNDSPPSPPQDSSQGAIAQAIRLWLRDCEARAISPP